MSNILGFPRIGKNRELKKVLEGFWSGKCSSQELESTANIIPKDRIVVSSSCSLLHTPFSKEDEDKIDSQILSWLSFAEEKIKEINVLEKLFRGNAESAIQHFLQENKKINTARKNSTKTNDKAVCERVKSYTKIQRVQPFSERIKIQKEHFNFPILSTTTIGSFPQTPELRALRLSYKKDDERNAYMSGYDSKLEFCAR